MADDTKTFLSTGEVSKLIGLTPDHLYRLRKRNGVGPPWCRHGRKVRYALADIELWLSQTRHA